MNRSEFAAALATRTGMTKKDANAQIEATFDIILNQLKLGEEVATPIGKFRVAHRAARQGRNPATGGSIEIPAKTVPKLTFNKTVRDALV